MYEQLRDWIDSIAQLYVGNKLNRSKVVCEPTIEQKLNSIERRNAEIVKCLGKVQIHGQQSLEKLTHLHYGVHWQFFIKQGDFFYVEENYQQRKAFFDHSKLIGDEILPSSNEIIFDYKGIERAEEQEQGRTAVYNRLQAVQYAEIWWNDYNPKFKKFEVDCTNYISQCLYAGGIQMIGFPNRNRGWWMRNDNWSYSWTVANAFRWHLSREAKTGLQARSVSLPEELLLGDVICYDFQGNGRFDHTTIVTGKDGKGEPLVNAHTTNSRKRYWSYEDSTAYTPNIQYKFFHILS